MKRPKRTKDDAVTEAVLILLKKFGNPVAALSHVVEMFSTNEIDILIDQLTKLPDDPS